jgi:hypothetical protein
MNARNLLFFITLLGIMAYSIVFTLKSGYFFAGEADSYLSHYLGNRPFLEKIYDFRVNELGSYRAREVSAVFNYLDAQFILLSAKIGFPHFLSFTHYAGLLFICLFHFFMAQKYLTKKMGWVTFLLLMLYLTASGPFFSGAYYRTSKILTSVSVVIQIWFLFVVHYRSPQIKKLHPSKFIVIVFGMFALTLLSILLDEGGYAFTLMFALYAAVNFVLFRKPTMLAVIIGYALGIIAAIIYRQYIGIWIIWTILGIKTPLFVSTRPILDVPNLSTTLRLLVSYFSFMFGNPPRLRIASVTLLGFFLMFFLKTKYKVQSHKNIPDYLVIFYGFIGAFAILHIMMINHGFMYYPEVSLLYYLIPFQTLYLVGLTFALYRLTSKWPKVTVYILGILLFIVGLNVRGIQQNYVRMLTTPKSMVEPCFSVSQKMTAAVRSPNVPLANFDLDKDATASVTILRKEVSLIRY